MKRRKLISHLRASGCVLIREGAEHSWWGNPTNGRRSSVPRHTEISDPLAKKICNDLDIPKP
ncbi:MAG: type II toxin-antitoxin system HicA family toxin [Isosphaeraceae bacterium]